MLIENEGVKKMNETLVEIGAIAAILELAFWVIVLYIIYKHNRGEEDVQ